MIYRIFTRLDNMMFFHITQKELEAKTHVDSHYHAGSPPEPQTGWQKVDAVFTLPDDYKKSQTLPFLPDVTSWGSNHLVFNRKAYNVASKYLKPFGEFLDVNCEGNDYYLFNILRVADGGEIDQNNSEREFATMDGMTLQVGIKRLKFKEDKLKGAMVFKAEFDEYHRIFCNAAFKRLIEEANLTGIEFRTDLADIF